MMYTAKVPVLLKEISKRNVLWEVDTEEKVLYLTFDDGPIPEVTTSVLSILKKYNAKATFFMVGDNVKKYPAIKQQVLDAGHRIGNHTMKHLKGFSNRNYHYYKNTLQASAYIESELFRPPHGQITPQQVKVLSKKYKIVMWSVLSGDFDSKLSPEQCWDKLRKNVKSGSIIVFHDSLKAQKNMIYALEHCLEYFTKMGYKFDCL